MWMQDEYEGFEGKYWSLPPRKILPKPYVQAPPADVVRRRQHDELRDGGPQGPRRPRLLGRARSTRSSRCSTAYKDEIANAEPVGAFVNDNIMVTTAGVRGRGRRQGPRSCRRRSRTSYLQSNVYRYHDTFPHPDWVPHWPELIPDAPLEDVEPARRSPAP